MFVGIYNDRFTFFGVFDFDRHNFIFEIAFFHGSCCSLLGAKCKFIALFSGDAPFDSHAVGDLDHGHVVLVCRCQSSRCCCRRVILVRFYGSREFVIVLAVRFRTAADRNVNDACLDLQSRIVDAGDGRTALHFDEGCGGLIRKSCDQGRISCKVMGVHVSGSTARKNSIYLALVQNVCLFAQTLDGHAG